MTKYYFTYGRDDESRASKGGWTEVEAPDFESACSVFRMYHPNKIEPLLNCCTVYTEENFKKTSMYQRPDGNFGYRCHETIILRRELLNN